MPSAARRLWPAFETYHAHIYFVPEAAEAYRALGLKGGWMGYFASRSAALGPASPRLAAGLAGRRPRRPAPHRRRRLAAPDPAVRRERGRIGGNGPGPGGGRGA